MSEPVLDTLTLTETQALYLYGLVHAAGVPIPPKGLHGAPVQCIPAGKTFVAVVDVVERAAWTGAEGEQNMQALKWVGPRAVMHEQVVEAVMDAGPVYPARFGTLFSSVRQLVTAVHAHEDTLRAFFRRMETAEEWAVQGFLDRDRAAEHLAGMNSKPATAAASGAAYLKQRLQEQKAHDEVDAWLAETAAALQHTLDDFTRERCTLDIRQSLQARADRSMAFNWALLVDRDDAESLYERVEAASNRHEGAGLTLRCTGPWPPYSFRPKLETPAPGTPDADGR